MIDIDYDFMKGSCIMSFINVAVVDNNFVKGLTKALKQAHITQLSRDTYLNDKFMANDTSKLIPAKHIYNKYLRSLEDDKFHIVQRALSENGASSKSDKFIGVELDSSNLSKLEFEFQSKSKGFNSPVTVSNYTVDGEDVAKAMANYLKDAHTLQVL